MRGDEPQLISPAVAVGMRAPRMRGDEPARAPAARPFGCAPRMRGDEPYR